jgi:hypothetical protein
LSKEVKGKKTEMFTVSSSSSNVMMIDDYDPHEDMITLYRYSSAALQSLLEKYKKSTTIKKALNYLEVMIKHDYEDNDILNPLNQGGLIVVCANMMPFFDQLMQLINTNINFEKLKEYGKDMIRLL